VVLKKASETFPEKGQKKPKTNKNWNKIAMLNTKNARQNISGFTPPFSWFLRPSAKTF
jgi:hypothetical protein